MSLSTRWKEKELSWTEYVEATGDSRSDAKSKDDEPGVDEVVYEGVEAEPNCVEAEGE